MIEQIRAYEWANGACIETFLHHEPQEGEDPSDRIHLFVTDQAGERRGWLMNVEDALAVIDCLTKAIIRAIDEGCPTMPEAQ